MDEEFKSFIQSLYQHFANNKTNDVAADYDLLRNLETTKYKGCRLPAPVEIEKIVKSTEKPITSSLPNEWLWDLINEFVYQFQIFHSNENIDKFVEAKPDIWHVRLMIEYLVQIIDKSNINPQLIAYVQQGDVNQAAGVFGRFELYKMLGYFSLVGLCRLYCLLSDYRSAMKVVENINLSQISLYDIVPGCLISLALCGGFSLMMCNKYYEAIKCFSSTISTIQKHDINDRTEWERMKILSLLSICVVLYPMNIEIEVDEILRDKFSLQITEMKKGNVNEITKIFNQGSIKPIPFFGDEIFYTQSNIKSRLFYQFNREIQKHCDLMKIRSFLNLYRNIDVSKIANSLEIISENAAPKLHNIGLRLFNEFEENFEATKEYPETKQEIFEHIRDIKDPEHPFSLERVGVVNLDDIIINDRRNKTKRENWVILTVYFTPTIPHCSMASFIGLSIKIRLLRSLPKFFKIFVKVKPGSHISELAINDQLNDKERVAAALENQYLVKEIKRCL